VQMVTQMRERVCEWCGTFGLTAPLGASSLSFDAVGVFVLRGCRSVRGNSHGTAHPVFAQCMPHSSASCYAGTQPGPFP